MIISEHDVLRIVEQAAIAASATMGAGNPNASDHAAVVAMRTELNALSASGVVVIGEGERDQAPMLYIGERVGKQKQRPQYDIAVDPLEGTNLTAQGLPNSITIIAVSSHGGLLHAPDVYMNKMVVTPELTGKVHLQDGPKRIMHTMSRVLKRTPQELVCVVLDRPRHAELIAELRAIGVRIQLIPDGDIVPAIRATVRGQHVHALLGVGAAPEGVIAAAAVKTLRGVMEAQFVAYSTAEERRLRKARIDINHIYTQDELAPGKEIIVAYTGVTNGDLLQGVRLFPGGARTHSMVLSNDAAVVRFVDTVHALDDSRLHSIISFV